LAVRNLYIVFETAAGLTIVDQHALHERVLYEDLSDAYARGPVRVQRLLIPETLELSPADKSFLMEAATELHAVGLLVEDFGGVAVAVQGVPAVVAKSSARELVEVFLAGVRSEERQDLLGEALQERFHSMACRAAVMAGDVLSEAEIRALLERASRLRHPHNCPHGRPTVLTFGDRDLGRHFKRLV
jgi:DNA mismatch repair protein MutL